MESGDVIFNGAYIENLDKSITPGYIRKKINSTGYIAMICYRPLEIIKRLGQTPLAIKGEVLYVMNYVSMDDLTKVIESAWDSLFFAVTNVKRLLEFSGMRKVTANDVYKKLVVNFNNDINKELNIHTIKIFLDFLPESKRNIGDLDVINNFFRAISLRCIQEILNSY